MFFVLYLCQNPLSWITGVHKVWYSVSNFYSKNSPLQQPCSHGAFRFTSAPHKIRLLDYWRSDGVTSVLTWALGSALPHAACPHKIRFLDFLHARYCRSLRFRWCSLHTSLPGFHPSGNPPLGLLAFTRFGIPFQIFILKILHFNNLVHMGRFVSLQPRTKSASWISFTLGIVVRFAFAGAHFIPRSPGFTRPEIRYTLSRYSFVLVSTLILSPLEIKNGTFTTAPVSSVAGFVPP